MSASPRELKTVGPEPADGQLDRSEPGRGARARHELAQAAEQAASSAPDITGLVRRYFRHAPTDGVAARAPADLVGAVRSHRRLAADRVAGYAAVEVLNPTKAADGWSCPATVLHVVTDDMPYLVGSVTAELARSGAEVSHVLHPVFVVRRDVLGRLLEVLPEADPAEPPVGTVVESWIQIEIDPVTDPARTHELEQRVRRVLGEVREVVEDTERMVATTHRVARRLIASGAPGGHGGGPADAAEAAYTANLLRWLSDGNFTFLGYRRYERVRDVGADRDAALRGVLTSGLGILRWDSFDTHDLPGLQGPVDGPTAPTFRLEPASAPSALHRSAHPSDISVTTFDEHGQVDGQHRWLGVFTPAAQRANVLNIPVIGRRVRAVLRRAGFPLESHSGQQLLDVMQDYPRAELFSTDTDTLYATATGVLAMAVDQRLRLFVRVSKDSPFVSCLVYLRRDLYTSVSLRAMREVLLTELPGEVVEQSAHVGESALATVHFLVRTHAATPAGALDSARLEELLTNTVVSWDDQLAEAVAEQEASTGSGGGQAAGAVAAGGASATERGRRYASAFPDSYKADFRAVDGLADLRRLLSLTGRRQMTTSLYVPAGGEPGELRFKLYLVGRHVILSHVLPLLLQMGVEVVDERQYEVRLADGAQWWIADFGLRAGSAAVPGQHERDFGSVSARFQDAFEAAWRGDAEVDAFNALVLRTGLDWQQAAVLRTYAKYLRQTETRYSQGYVEEALVENPSIAAALVGLFEARFDPSATGENRSRADEIAARLATMIDDVAALDADLILRAFMALIQATSRTNYFVRDDADARRPFLAVKLDPRQVPYLPEPRPYSEVFVCSPRVEGVHLRFGPVARGGLRWSDRKADYRAEVLGLARAQTAKNAMIVPVGAKGGFVVKRPPTTTGDPTTDRRALQEEAVACYRMFVSGLLDLTDNLVAGAARGDADGRGSQAVRTDPRVVRHDGDDPYLVVAADKGTATFSDLANDVARSYGYWLDDAFASGGSAGYDHKAMGITARGAWESVRRHFREMGVDTQHEDFTAVGIGDMSGDVFGNGMLLSPHIRLVAAFDHRHVFLDPAPDAASSFAERQRLFSLPGSAWSDYDRDAISEGGGVWPRSAKSVPVSPQARTTLGLPDDVTRLSPPELISAILRAPVDLLWNGGIGTYVKASAETHEGVGDRTGDAVRVDATELRAKVVAEGGNLGLTQRGRIEFARNNGKVNTDAIDNSAGVDCSDHEVNIKIILDRLVAENRLNRRERDQLLVEMTDEVAALVLADNRRQNMVLGVARTHAAEMFPVHSRLITDLEERGVLDRKLESLPTVAQCKALEKAGDGLSSPELAVLLAQVKRELTSHVLASELPDTPAFARRLADYFPPTLRKRFGDALAAHPLRREIIATLLVNEVVDYGGISYVFRLGEDMGTSDVDAVRAFAIASEVFALPSLWTAIGALDTSVATSVADDMVLVSRRLLDRAARWLLSNRPQPLAVGAETRRFAPVLAELAPAVMALLRGGQRDGARELAARLAGQGVPAGLARRVATLLPGFALLDVTEATELAGLDTGLDTRLGSGLGTGLSDERGYREIAELYFALTDLFDVEYLLNAVSRLRRDDRWHALARLSLREDVYASIRALTLDVARDSEPGVGPDDMLAGWAAANSSRLTRARPTLRGVSQANRPDLAQLLVATRQIRSMIR